MPALSSLVSLQVSAHQRAIKGEEPVHQQLSLLERYLDLIVESAPIMMHVVDRDFKIVKVNQRWLQTMGYRLEDVLGRSPTEFLTEESRERATKDVIPLFMDAGSDRSIGVDLVTRDGRVLSRLLDAEADCTTGRRCSGYAVVYDPHDLADRAQASTTIEALRRLIRVQPNVGDGRHPVSGTELDAKYTTVLQVAKFKAHTDRMSKEEDTPLTKRELDVLTLLALGGRNKEIAEQLSLSINTVKFHIENVYQKLGVASRTQAVRVAIGCGLLKI